VSPTVIVLVVAAALAAADVSAVMRAQQSTGDLAASTTSAGVFTAAQATRGEETYMAICVSCHPRGTYATPAFRATWTGRPLSELFDFVREKMPKNDPGSLRPGEYAQVIAYILKINDAPAGDHELPAESEPLKKIRIELPAVQ
jgi:hypothetical protein